MKSLKIQEESVGDTNRPWRVYLFLQLTYTTQLTTTRLSLLPESMDLSRQGFSTNIILYILYIFSQVLNIGIKPSFSMGLTPILTSILAHCLPTTRREIKEF